MRANSRCTKLAAKPHSAVAPLHSAKHTANELRREPRSARSWMGGEGTKVAVDH